MNLFSRARRHVDMNRVKELREEKIKEEKIADIRKQQEEIIAKLKKIEIKESLKYSNWRRDLSEGMTTDDLGMINLAATGDLDIIDTTTVYDSSIEIQNSTRSGTTLTLRGTRNQIANGTHTYYNFAKFEVDGTRVTHVKITISKGGGTSSWTDRDESWDDNVSLSVFDRDNLDDSDDLYYDDDLGSGTHIIPIPRTNSKNLRIDISQFGKVGETGALTISNVSLQRRNPISLLVSLDDPEASSFIRTDPVFSELTAEERKKKLEEMLKAGDEYLLNMFGDDFPGTGNTDFAEYEPQPSFMDILTSDGDRITKQDGETIRDTTRDIEPKPTSIPQSKPTSIPQSKPTSIPQQLPVSISQPKPQPKDGSEGGDTSSYEDREGFKTGIPAVDYSSDIAGSISSNTPVNIPQKNIPKDQIDKLINAIDPDTIGEYGIPVNTTPQPYSDDNFYELPNGEVRAHTASSRAKYPNNTNPLSSGNAGFMGRGNPLGVAGQAQAQFVVPKDGSEPYYQYTDHAYVNSAQMGGGEIPDPIKTVGAIGVHAASGYGKKFSPLDSPYLQTGGVLDTTTPNTGKMKNYPSNIRGDVRKQIRVPLSQMPSKVQDAVNKQIKLGIKESVIEESKQKKRLKSPKSVFDKIPGYYDGKPSPLGFPLKDPPKMINGYHPDLVDGKKVSQRYNRLDPISARSMPPTGNPHIDKKVKAAAKKPK